jgi:TonB family protein
MQARSLLAALLFAGCASMPPANPTVNVVDSTETVKAPEVVSRVEPGYPDVDRRNGVQGAVEVEVVVDEAGNVAETHILHTPSSTLGDAVAAAVAQWRFTPSELGGKPVRVVFSVLVPMKL